MFGNSIRLGRVFGLTVKVDFSLIILMGLLAVAFHSSLPNSGYEGIIVSTLYATLFVLSIFAHELGHVFAGRKLGVPFDTITLFIFGGAAHMTKLPQKPKDEALMAIAGPATSIGLAAVLSILFGYIIPVTGPILSMFISLIFFS